MSSKEEKRSIKIDVKLYEFNNLKNSIETAKKAIGHFKEEVKKAEKEVKKLKKTKGAFADETIEAEKKLDKLKKRLKDQEKDLPSLEAKFKKVSREIKDVSQSCLVVDRSVNMMKKSVDNAVLGLENLKLPEDVNDKYIDEVKLTNRYIDELIAKVKEVNQNIGKPAEPKAIVDTGKAAEEVTEKLDKVANTVTSGTAEVGKSMKQTAEVSSKAAKEIAGSESTIAAAANKATKSTNIFSESTKEQMANLEQTAAHLEGGAQIINKAQLALGLLDDEYKLHINMLAVACRSNDSLQDSYFKINELEKERKQLLKDGKVAFNDYNELIGSEESVKKYEENTQKIAEIHKQLLPVIKEQAEKEKVIAKDKAYEKYRIECSYQDLVMQLYKKGTEEYKAAKKAKTEANKEYYKALEKNIKEHYTAVKKEYDEYDKYFKELEKTELEFAKLNLEQELKDINENKEKQLLTDTEYAEKTKAAQEKFDKKKQQIESRQAIREKALAIYKLVNDTASAVMSAASTKPFFPAGIAAMAAVVAAGAKQLAVIKANGLSGIPKAARGKLIGGLSHAAGGTLIEAEKGEAIINKKSVGLFPEVLSLINQMGGGVPFTRPNSDGGFAVREYQRQSPTPALTANDIADAVKAGVQEVKIFTAIEDINKGQAQYAVVANNNVF